MKMKLETYFEQDEVCVEYAGNQFGYFDKLIVAGSEAHLIDYKFARLPYEADSPQFWAYCVGIWNRYPSIEKITVHVLLPFRGEIDVEEFTRKEHFELFCVRVSAIVANAERDNEDDRRPGEQCQYCIRRGECKKLLSMSMQIVQKLDQDEVKIPQHLDYATMSSPEVLYQAKRVAKILRKWCAGVDARALELAREGVQIPGYELKERKSRFAIVAPSLAYSILRDQGLVTPEEFAEACKVSIGSLDDIVKAKAPRGKKTSAVKEMRTYLVEGSAAIDEGTTQYLAAIKDEAEDGDVIDIESENLF